MSDQAYQDGPLVHHFGYVRPGEAPIPFYSFTMLEATDVDGNRHIFHVPTAALQEPSRDTEIERYGKNRTSERLRDENAVLDATRRHEDRDTEIERIADALESLEPGEHMDDGNWPAALYAVGLRSQPASEPTTWAAPTSAPSLDVERLASAVSMVNLGYHEVGDHRARGSTTRRQRGCGMNREHKRCWRCCVRERGWHRCLSL